MTEGTANGTGSDVLIGAVREVPNAALAFAQDAWNHPGQFALNTGKTALESAAIGIAMGALIPSRGLAAGIATFAFTAPIVYSTLSRIGEAYHAGNAPGANTQALSESLAHDLVHEGWDFAIGSAGGIAGAHIGHGLATNETILGYNNPVMPYAQAGQRMLLRGENLALLGLSRGSDAIAGLASLRGGVSEVPPVPSSNPAGVRPAAGIEIASPTPIVNTNLDAPTVTPSTTGTGLPGPSGFARSWFMDANMRNRVAQVTAQPQDYTLRMGSLHGHSHYSDGMGSPSEIFGKAKADGMDFYAITDHNHLAARQGVAPSDPRAADQANVPILASMPAEYASTMADAAAATEPGKFVGIVGVEMGTIGHVGGGGHGGGHGGNGSSIETGGPVVDPTTAEGETFHTSRNTILGDPHAGHNHGTLPDSFATMQVPADLPAPTVVRRITEPDGRIIEHRHTLPQAAAAQAYREQAFLNAQRSLAAAHEVGPTDTTTTATAPLNPQQQAIADAIARDNSHLSGINHVNVFEYPELIIADRAGDTAPKAAGAIHYNDGDFNGLLQQLGTNPDTTGGLPVWQFNHPRFLADNNANLPANLRGRDYGAKSFPSQAAWVRAMDPYVHQVEVITGEALNPDPVTVMKPQDLGPVNMAGYIDRGFHVSPTFGRDDHFALPGGRPAGTGILASSLDKPSLLNGLRNRQTIATTSTELLQGYMTANESFPMGSILDQNAVNDLNIRMHMVGQIDPAAQYTMNLWADPKIGDGKLATMIQTRSLLGRDLINNQGMFDFDQVHHTIGNRSAWYVEVQRVDPTTSNNDYMWTAPVWVEPLSGTSHSLLTRALIGAGTANLTGS
jgi:hypothetical protein